MKPYQQQFIEFLIKNKALQFGDFTLKNGRQSPYFINTGIFETGAAIERLGYFYAALIKEEFANDFEVVFGPAYKGISLAITTVIALNKDFGLNKFYAFNRKEIKDHGDKKLIIGHNFQDNDQVIIIDDVITDGGTKFETVALLNQLAKVKFTGLVIAVNRQEKTAEGLDAFKNLENKLNMPVKAIVSISDILEYLNNKEINGQIHLSTAKAEAIKDYLKKYGTN